MLLPILSYGHSILRKKCKNIDSSFPDLVTLADNMWDTLYAANGMGLAAPQVNKDITLFIVDSTVAYHNRKGEKKEESSPYDLGIKELFMNALITEYSEETWKEAEGCLSMPDLQEEVQRSWRIKIEYYDLHFTKQERIFEGLTARTIQHEYDHTQGILYIDHLSPIKRSMLAGKLNKISKGQIKTSYKMKFLK